MSIADNYIIRDVRRGPYYFKFDGFLRAFEDTEPASQARLLGYLSLHFF
jgi:hypothetical protein